jgi:hypothetical protein
VVPTRGFEPLCSLHYGDLVGRCVCQFRQVGPSTNPDILPQPLRTLQRPAAALRASRGTLTRTDRRTPVLMALSPLGGPNVRKPPAGGPGTSVSVCRTT